MTGAQPTNMQIWPGGSLDVVGLLYIGDGSTGNIGQLGGITTVGTLQIVRGGYAMGNGTFTVGSVTLGGQSNLASIATSDGTTSVTGNLDMLTNSVITVGNGTVTVGGTATVGGRFAVTGRLPDLIQLAALTVVPGGVIAPFVTSNGVDPINVTGTAQLTGTLSVTDFSAMTGTWDVIVAGDLQGTFSAVQLPDANWSWGIDGNRVWIEKGAGSPVEAASWGGVKSEYRTGAR